MILRLRSIMLASAVAAGLSACGTAPQAPRGPQATPLPRPVVPSALSAADYVAAAGSIDLYVIRASELAQERSTDARIRDAAQGMIAGHRGLAAQLSFAGRRLNIVPPAAMRGREQALYEALLASGDFNATYRRQQLAVHREALSIHQSFADRGASPTLRPVAANAAAVIRRHLAILEAL